MIGTRRMLNLVRPRLVTFDVTGTLLSTKLVEHYSEIALQHGVTVADSPSLARSFKSNFKRLEREHPIYGRHTGLGWQNWWKQIVYSVFKEQDHQLSDESLEKVANSLIECYGTDKCWERCPGVIELLNYLRGRGLILGVISNFDERLDSILASTRIKPYFSFIISSYAYGEEKPHPSIFGEALRLTREIHGIVLRPEEAFHVGDTLNHDYLGATNARWNAALVNRHRDSFDHSLIPQAHQFADLPQLHAHFQSLLENQHHTTI